MDRQLGIIKGGNRRVRSLAVEIAWCWIRYQPRSKLQEGQKNLKRASQSHKADLEINSRCVQIRQSK
jgi:transposase